MHYELYEVGKEQLWGWCHWQGRFYGTGATILCNADSLRKGRYVVVEHRSMFGRCEGVSYIYFDFGSLRDAVDYVGKQTTIDATNIEMGFSDIGTDYEIWHIVDDSELWDEWDRLAGVSAVGLVRCADCGRWVVSRYSTTYRHLGANESDEPEYRCPTCAERYAKEGWRYTPYRWSLDMYIEHSVPRCVLCGDNERGPWTVYRNTEYGYFFRVCEPCENMYKKVRATMEGARLA